MAILDAFKRGDEVLSKFPGGSLMMVLAVEGLKVRCADSQNTQYWFDKIMLERYEPSPRPAETLTTLHLAARTAAADVGMVG
jgi:hypothetical protein